MSEVNLDRRVVCSAIRNSSGDIILGARHFDYLMSVRITEYKYSNLPIDRDAREALLKERERVWRNSDQGFINTWGEFLTRQQAWKVAEHNGQIIQRVGGDEAGGGTLYSENLY